MNFWIATILFYVSLILFNLVITFILCVCDSNMKYAIINHLCFC